VVKKTQKKIQIKKNKEIRVFFVLQWQWQLAKQNKTKKQGEEKET
jgi:hypothetical protein